MCDGTFKKSAGRARGGSAARSLLRDRSARSLLNTSVYLLARVVQTRKGLKVHMAFHIAALRTQHSEQNTHTEKTSAHFQGVGIGDSGNGWAYRVWVRCIGYG